MLCAGSLFLLPLSGCGSYVEKSQYDESQRQLQEAQTQLAEAKRQLQQAREQVKEASNPKFSTYKSSFRTWRFNAVTGETCILLTTDDDWKRKKTKAASCECEDATKTLLDSYRKAEPKELTDIWARMKRESCGE